MLLDHFRLLMSHGEAANGGVVPQIFHNRTLVVDILNIGPLFFDSGLNVG